MLKILIENSYIENALCLVSAIADEERRASLYRRALEILSANEQFSLNYQALELVPAIYFGLSPSLRVPVFTYVLKVLTRNGSTIDVHEAFTDMLQAVFATDPSFTLWRGGYQPRVGALCELKDAILALVEAGKIELARTAFPQALAAAHQIGFKNKRVEALGALAEALVAVGLVEDANQTFREADLCTRAITQNAEQDEAREALAKSYAQVGNFTVALAFAREISDNENRDFILSKIISLLIQDGSYDEACGIVSEITVYRLHNRALGEIASSLIVCDRISDALKIVKQGRSEVVQKFLMGELAQKLIDMGKLDQALVIVQEIGFWRDGVSTSVFEKVVWELIHAKRISEAVLFLQRVPDGPLTKRFKSEILKTLSDAGHYSGALSLVGSREPLQFLTSLADLVPGIDKVASKLSIRIYVEIIRIACWASPSHWREIYQIVECI